MRVRKRRLLGVWLLGLAVLVCLATASCEPKHIQTTPQGVKQTGLDGQADKKTTPLSKEQIIAIADAVARDYGWQPEERLAYDKGNVLWEAAFRGVRVPELEGHDYQVLVYGRRGVLFGGDLSVVVDRNTGAVLKILREP